MATHRPPICTCNPIYHRSRLHRTADYCLNRNIDDEGPGWRAKTQFVDAHALNDLSDLECRRQIDDRPKSTIRTHSQWDSSGRLRVRACAIQYVVMARCRR